MKMQGYKVQDKTDGTRLGDDDGNKQRIFWMSMESFWGAGGWGAISMGCVNGWYGRNWIDNAVRDEGK